MLKQLSIFAENKKGTMEHITWILVQEQINILGSVTNDSAEYGIVRMVVSNPEIAHEALIKAGYLCQLSSVIGVELEDKVGNLNQLLQTLSESNINVDYIYLSFNRNSGKPVLIFHADDIYEVENCITMKGFTCIDDKSVLEA
ncbi:MAG: amino acid-binding protein [Lachnospiraceae bacterium]|nr:amino acid-binding protein [Lachnospiraceae bacterium]